MTHDELTAMLRNLPTPSIGGPHPGGVQMMAADRLDRYQYLLEMSLEHLSRNWPSVDYLRDTIREEIK